MSEPTTNASDEGVGFDAGATARQVALYESANGVPNGLLAVILAFVIAAISYPLYRLRQRR